jgi:ATP-dependent DNA helicase RecQ
VIQITEYSQNNIIVPISEIISKTELSGTTCVLTKTNEEAMLLSGLLLNQGLHARLIQSNDGFNLSNLYELRYFSDIIDSDSESPIISDDEWTSAKRQLNNHINGSSKKELANNVIKAFEDINTTRKYKSDWKSFLFESKVEDFITIDSELIYVSTIHKAKGKEFDNVFLLLKDFAPDKDENKRQFYVAITRAKQNLHIHYNGNYLQNYSTKALVYRNDNSIYPEPEQIAFYLTHRDVQLGYFEYVQHRIKSLLSGNSLRLAEDGLANSAGEITLKYSQRFKDILTERKANNFKIVEAKVNFIVYWKDETKEKESKIILPLLILKKTVIK